MPSLAKLYKEFKDEGFVVLAINVRENKERVKRDIGKEGGPFPILLDNNGKVARDYGVRASPLHFIIDGKGKMIGVAMGAKDWADTQSKDLIRFLIKKNRNEE